MSSHGHSHGGEACHGHGHAHGHGHLALAEDVPDEDSDGTLEMELAVDENGRIKFNGTMDFSFGTFSDAVSLGSAEERAALLTDCAHAMTARARGIGLSEGRTYFVTQSMEPRCALEAMAQEIFNFHTAGAKFDPDTSGAEWWTQVIDADDDIGFHWDKDFALEEFDVNIHPHLATVTYLNEGFVGAPTVVFDKNSCEMYGDDFSGGVSRASVSFPQPGKHMCFDGRLVHGAPSDLRVDTLVSGEEPVGSAAAEAGAAAAPAAGAGGGGGGAKGGGGDGGGGGGGGGGAAAAGEDTDDDSDESQADAAAQELIAEEGLNGTTTQATTSASKKRRQLRVTFLVNVWLNHIPMLSGPLPEPVLANMKCGRTLPTPGINVNLVPGVTKRNEIPVLGLECKQRRRVAESDSNSKKTTEALKAIVAADIQEGSAAEQAAVEAAMAAMDADSESDLPTWEFHSDEQLCRVYVRVPLPDICRREYKAGHEAFQIDLGELSDPHAADPDADEVDDGAEGMSDKYLEHLLAEFDCEDLDDLLVGGELGFANQSTGEDDDDDVSGVEDLDLIHSDDGDDDSDDDTETDGDDDGDDDDAPVLNHTPQQPAQPVEDLFGDAAWDGSSPTGTDSPFAGFFGGDAFPSAGAEALAANTASSVGQGTALPPAASAADNPTPTPVAATAAPALPSSYTAQALAAMDPEAAAAMASLANIQDSTDDDSD